MSAYKEILACDLYRNFEKRSLPFYFFFINKKYRYLITFRYYGHLLNKGDSFFLKLIRKVVSFENSRVQNKLGMEIPISTIIGRGISIPHPNGIVINSKAVIGEYCTILQQVTIGNNIRKGRYALPVIGRNVTLSAGAKIIGPCNIGDNVTVGANSVVVTDIGENEVVAGVPAKSLKVEKSS